MFALLAFFIGVSQAAFDPAPAEKLSCLADVFPVHGEGREIPLTGFHPHRIVLQSDQTDVSQAWSIVQVELKPKYAPFYSTWALFPWENLSPSDQEMLVGTSPVPFSQISIRLSRFAATATRVAGFAIEANVERGYRAGFLFRPHVEGTNFVSRHLVRTGDDPRMTTGHLHLTCWLD
jgi:hypothetical protein